MRQKIERERDVPGPCMGDADARKLWEALGHHAMERRHTHLWPDLSEPSATPEQDPPAVR